MAPLLQSWGLTPGSSAFGVSQLGSDPTDPAERLSCGAPRSTGRTCRRGARRGGRGPARRGCCAGSPTCRPRSSWPAPAGRRSAVPCVPCRLTSRSLGAAERVVVADQRLGPHQVDGEGVERLVQLREGQLGDRHLGAGVAGRAFWAARMFVRRPTSACTHSCIRRSLLAPVLLRLVELASTPRRRRWPPAAGLADPAAAATDGVALVHQRGQAGPPALADVADAVTSPGSAASVM